MKQYYSYTRVSTTRQGERGVSLTEQRDAISRYALRNNLEITQSFEEQQTAAKEGRPLWNTMLRLLRQKKAAGVIIHKIDRSARNLKDWADLGELIDQGIEVHFANESLDLHSRGGRLSADIQAVVASDFIRNLREETKKGLYGRLKQGFYPLPAPIGYLNNGAAKPKTIDPEKGPLVRRALEMYAAGQWSIPTLVDEMYRRGLRTHSGGRVGRTSLHSILRNPFYMGIIRIRAANQTFAGNHEALITKRTFDRIQDILHGRVSARTTVHDFPFRRFVKCGSCGYSLIGELQKGNVYYRCHTKTCPTTTIREDAIVALASGHLKKLEFTAREQHFLRQRIEELKTGWIADREQRLQGLKVKVEQMTERLTRLTDAYLDQVLERDLFEERKATLLQDRRALEDTLAKYQSNRLSVPEELEKFLELAGSAYSLYQKATTEKRRQLLRTVTSNCIIHAKILDFTYASPFREVAAREKSGDGAPSKEIHRTLEELLGRVSTILASHPINALTLTDILI